MSDFDVLALVEGTFEELEDECVIVDHRSDDRETAESLAAFIHTDNGTLQWEEDDGNAYLSWRTARQRIPLTHTTHDRYVTISSVAYVLRESYDLWLLRDRLGDDTHSVLLLSKADSAKLEAAHPRWSADTLERLELGYDYFNKIRVPFAGNEDHNPRFLEDAARVENERQEVLEAMKHLLRGNDGTH